MRLNTVFHGPRKQQATGLPVQSVGLPDTIHGTLLYEPQGSQVRSGLPCTTMGLLGTIRKTPWYDLRDPQSVRAAGLPVRSVGLRLLAIKNKK